MQFITVISLILALAMQVLGQIGGGFTEVCTNITYTPNGWDAGQRVWADCCYNGLYILETLDLDLCVRFFDGKLICATYVPQGNFAPFYGEICADCSVDADNFLTCNCGGNFSSVDLNDCVGSAVETLLC